MIGNHALACAPSSMGTSMAFLRFRYGIEFDNRLYDQFDYIKIDISISWMRINVKY